MNLQLLAILILLVLSNGASNSPRDVYQTELNKIITTLNVNLDSSTKQLDHTLAAQQQFKAQNTLARQLLIQGLSNFRAVLRNTINNTAIPYNLVTWKCNSTSFQNYNKIATSNQQILINIKNIETQISGLAASPQVTQLKNTLELLKKETNLLQAQFKYLCPVNSVDNNGKPIAPTTVPPQPLQPTVPPTTPTSPTIPNQPGTVIPANQTWVSNLDNPTNNWIFGNINPKTYYTDVNKLITDGAQLCPAQTPYIDTNNKCITCQYVYDANLKTCVACPPGTTYNQSIHQCDSSGGTFLKNSYSGVQNYIGTLPQTITDLSTCPLNTPYFNGKQCIACPLPNYFDFTLKVCAQCEKDKNFDMTYKICKPINNSVTPHFPVFNSNIGTTSQNYVGTIPPAVSTANTCPEGQPFFNGLNCISCSLPLYFNFTSSACSTCPTSQKFDPTTKTCVIDISKVLYVSSLSGVSNYIGNPPNIPANNDKKILGCPGETPFSGNQQCIACALPKFFNFQTNQCELCSVDLTFDTSLKKCVPKTTTSANRNNNLQGNTNFMYQVPNFDSSLLTCPATTSYFNGNTCIACTYPMYFNFKTLQCQNCPIGLKFNTQNRQCEYEKQTFVTDTSNQNVFFNGNYSNIANEINNKRVQQGLITCPKQTPYYDTTKNACINCPSDAPIFNIRYNKCISCGNDAYFNKYTRICTHRIVIAPTLQRTLMNTFRI